MRHKMTLGHFSKDLIRPVSGGQSAGAVRGERGADERGADERGAFSLLNQGSKSSSVRLVQGRLPKMVSTSSAKMTSRS